MADNNIATAAGGDRSWKFAAKIAWGYPFNFLKNCIEHVFGYTHISKKVSAATAGAVLASTNGSASKQTITTGITNPDVPRVLAITIGGSGYTADSIVINGTNVEGKKIADTIAYTVNGQVVGKLVFKTVTSVVIPASSGALMTVTVDTTNRLGLVHRLTPNFGTIVVIQDTVEEDATKPTAQAAPSSSNLDGQLVEKNWVVPATAPDGTTFLYFFYWEHKVKIQPVKDSPDFYSTTTSTSSTSSSTSTSSTSSSTSISSTSSSISSTSSSISTTTSISTSSSTSSTSTSTTTLPI